MHNHASVCCVADGRQQPQQDDFEQDLHREDEQRVRAQPQERSHLSLRKSQHNQAQRLVAKRANPSVVEAIPCLAAQ